MFDVVVLGSGVGGYPAAIRAAQLGKRVALVEKGDMGGTCLNRGCIPSKALIAGAEVYERVKEASLFGITTGEVKFDYEKMVERKDKVVAKVRKGLEGLIQANKIEVFKGTGRFVGEKEISVKGDKEVVLKGKNIIIATGSEPRNFSQFPFDYERIHDSTSLLNLKKLPKKIAIIGGGVIGCEFASLYNTFNVEVMIFELMPSILPMEPKVVSSHLTKIFKSKGIKIETGANVKAIEKTANGIKVILEKGEPIEADIALVAVGRTMNTKDIGLEIAKVKMDDKGNIPTNEKMETNVPGIYAVGDISSKWWLAHVASHQGLVAASNACGIETKMHYNAVPSVIFTQPEIGTVGLSYEQAIEKGYDAKVGQFPFQALGKSQATIQTEGYGQVVIDKKTGEILGAQVIGHEASALIAEMVLAIQNELTVESIIDTIHAHPTVAEVWLESALMAFDSPLHFPPKQSNERNV